MCNKQGHISRDCRSPQAAELRAKGTIGGPYTKGTSWNKGKGKGKYGKGKGINELQGQWPEEPEGENAGDIQAMGGGIQIGSVVNFLNPKSINHSREKERDKREREHSNQGNLNI